MNKIYRRKLVTALAKKSGMKASPAPHNKNALASHVPLDWLEKFYSYTVTHKSKCNPKFRPAMNRNY